MQREVLVMLIAGIFLLLFAAIVPAPIDQPLSDAGGRISDSQAPWFFLWIQQLLKLGDPFLLGVLVPVLVVVALGILLPYFLPTVKHKELGNWFPHGNRIAQVLVVLILLVIIVLTVIGAVST